MNTIYFRHEAIMTIRFTAACREIQGPLTRFLQVSVYLTPANDNPAERKPLLRTVSSPSAKVENAATLAKALMHFARYGLSAAAHARNNAQAAHAAGDCSQSNHWLEICGQLDRRMAKAASYQLKR